MKKLLTDWRTYLLIVQMVVCVFLLFCEVDTSRGVFRFIVDIVLTRFAGIIILLFIVDQYGRWYKDSGLDRIFGGENEKENEPQIK